jgi:phage terminase large subunit-like protein
MTSVLDAPNDLRGEQRPRVWSIPESVSSTGPEALELCRMAGLYLDAWQEFVFTNALGERPDGQWAAFEVGVDVARQNGKGAILEARELAGLFLLPEKLIIHSAHQFDTSLEAFRRLLFLIEDTPDLDRRVTRVSRSHGEEGIELKDGSRIRFRTRTKGGGRGFSCDCLMLDEAMFLPESAHGALLPTLSARPNPQVWYTGSAVDQTVHENGVVFARIRERGHRGSDPRLAYFEWSADFANPEDVGDATEGELWAQANPGLGIRITREHIAAEQRSMDPRTFAVERLGVGDWPRTDGSGEFVIDPEAWAELADEKSVLADPIILSYDVSPDRSRASIAAAGRRRDGLFHVEVVERKPGTGWVPERVARLVEKHKPLAVICDGVGPAASLVYELEPFGVEVKSLNTQEHAQACGLLYDAVERKSLRHLGGPELASAIKGAAKRPLGDAWAWSRKNSHVDISPLVACTLALWGASQYQPVYRSAGFR